jgi:Trp operon repressor
MTHVSKKELGSEVSKKLFTQFFQTLNKAGRSGEARPVASELFTHTEQIMLAKRLMVILLLDKGIPQHAIAKDLYISPTTIAKFSLRISEGKYGSILKISGKLKHHILEDIEKFLLMGMPPRVGRGRWGKWAR